MRSNGLDLASLVTARRLLLNSRDARKQTRTPLQKKTNVLDHFKEDQALLSGNCGCRESCQNHGNKLPAENLDIKLADLINRLQDPDQGVSDPSESRRTRVEARVSVHTEVKTEFRMEYRSLERVDGLVLRDSQLAETDRYRFEFLTADRLRIVDKWSNRCTTIWGDPHVDVDDVEGARDGDFKDLSGSNTHTTFMLLDGTRLTITALDDGIIEAVDIYKDNERVRGYGGASSLFNEGMQYFQQDPVDLPSSVPLGDVVRAGGDGNDWYSPSGSLLWGQTTGPAIQNRPQSVLQMSLTQEVSQAVEASISVDTQV